MYVSYLVLCGIAVSRRAVVIMTRNSGHAVSEQSSAASWKYSMELFDSSGLKGAFISVNSISMRKVGRKPFQARLVCSVFQTVSCDSVNIDLSGLPLCIRSTVSRPHTNNNTPKS